MSADRLPPGFGPVLARSREVEPSDRTFMAVGVGVFCAAIGVYAKFLDLDWPWIVVPPTLLYVLLISSGFTATVRAGNGWFANCGRFVRTDRLTKLRARIALSGTFIEMSDEDHRFLVVRLSHVTQNSDVWRLVLAGILVSIGRGLVVTDNNTSRIFGIPKSAKNTRPCRQVALNDGDEPVHSLQGAAE